MQESRKEEKKDGRDGGREVQGRKERRKKENMTVSKCKDGSERRWIE